MFLSCKIGPPTNTAAIDCLVLFVSTEPLSKEASTLDTSLNGLISELKKRGELDQRGKHIVLHNTNKSLKAKKILLMSLGKQSTLPPRNALAIIEKLIMALEAEKVSHACISADQIAVVDRKNSWLAQQLAIKAVSASYRYTQSLSKPKKPSSLKKLTVFADKTQQSAISKALNKGKAIAEGMNISKELGDLPGNYCTPSYLASRARQVTKVNKKLTVSVLGENKLKELGMGSFLSVTAGSNQAAKLIVMKYMGGNKNSKPTVLVGKGITFDTGGISLKPGAAMDEMKYDMCGAASVVGTLHAVAALKAPINLIGVIAACENMPNGNATKPGDVVTSMSGKTIEVLNTDAEGRLVLCDALTYVERFKPKQVIDIATLTGACVIALGKHATGLYSNKQALADSILTAGEQVEDRAWQMPLWDDYTAQLDSNFADLANIGGREAGSVTAACFLAQFAKAYDWAHLDIAGTAWKSGARKGATGRPVPLLVEHVLGS